MGKPKTETELALDIEIQAIDLMLLLTKQCIDSLAEGRYADAVAYADQAKSATKWLSTGPSRVAAWATFLKLDALMKAACQ